MGRRNRILAVMAVLLVALVPAGVSVAVGAVGRQQTVDDSRAGCLRTSARNADVVNVWEAQLAANTAAAHDPGTSPRTRAARAAELPEIRAGIGEFDQQIDRGDWKLLHASADRRAVRRSAFACTAVYPSTSLLP